MQRLPKRQLQWMGSALRNETTGGVLLLVAAVTALVWANLDFASYNALREFKIGPAELHLDLSLGKWAADGLLAIFFFVAGMELKHELVVGSLKDKSVAAVPIAAAVGGMAVPALIFFAFNLGESSVVGWGIPMATDIAFALAIIWAALHESGIHATIAGVAMGLLMNLKQAEPVMHRIHPISAGFAVPVFAFFSAGAYVQGLSIEDVFASPVAMGIMLGLVVGKPIGIVGTAWLMARFTNASLSKKLSWWDVATIGTLAGVGFTVSLLINELAFKGDEAAASMGTLAVLLASTLAAIFATMALQLRKRAYSVA